MITVGGGTGINFSSKRAKDSKNGTAGGQFGVAGTVEAAKVNILIPVVGSELWSK